MMEELRISLKKSIKTICEVEAISPDALENKSIKEIYSETAYVGKDKVKLKDMFEIEGSTSKKAHDQKIILNGNFSKVKRIGQEMTAGEIVVNGNIGMHLGEKMKGGKITINGNVDSFVCCNATGGDLKINGNVKHHLVSSYRGSWVGSSNICVDINGSVGNEAAKWFYGSEIRISGDVGSFVGCHMQDGIIIIEGKCKGRIAPFMKGGQIIILKKTELLAGFEYSKEIQNLVINNKKYSGIFHEYIGDNTENGNGHIYVKQ